VPRPNPSEYPSYFDTYIKLVSEEDIMSVLQHQHNDFTQFIRSIPESDAVVLHTPYTWSIKQVIGHLIDSEMVFDYRALCFARGDVTVLPAFDENLYVANANFNDLSIAQLADQFSALRQSTICMFKNFSTAAWNSSGQAGSGRMSVSAAAYVLVGHIRHHGAIIKKRLHRS
jgi:DinB superfamily